MLSTMQDYPLTVRDIFEHGERLYADSQVVTFDGVATRRASFGQVADRARRLAAALLRLGVQPDERIATFCWSHQEHLEAYFAVPCIGAVLHTLNVRLHEDQIAYIVNHAEDSTIIVDDCLIPVLAPIVPKLTTVKRYIVIGSAEGFPVKAIDYEELVNGESALAAFPMLDERSAAMVCYTSGTTGNPKGVVYSHRSIYMHTYAIIGGQSCGVASADRVIVIVPMFHANAWGGPHAAWWVGADIIFPGRHLQPEPLYRLIALEKPSFGAAIPTIWGGLVRYAEEHSADLSMFRLMICGGAAMPRSLLERMQARGAYMVQGWGLTETSPTAAVAHPPHGVTPEEAVGYRCKTGRILPGLEVRIVSGEKVLPWDGRSAGEIEIRGPWVTASYYKDNNTDAFHEGWLRTGDVGTVDPHGYLQITDRAKDVIKSGGEWVSSVELENHLVGHPDVLEAAVIGVADEHWGERPMACVVLKDGAKTTPEEMRAFLATRVARWWLPERWAIVTELPKTSVGKFDKKALRKLLADGKLGPRAVAEQLEIQ
jgi:fatty-acyl-CoA synthase